jgi:TPR repeat protein
MAEQYLNGSNVSRNSQTAARWLWAAVEKGNVTAEIALSDLYAAGEGIDRNCAQARILLQAAAKKGNATAVEKLRAVNRYGPCTN